MLINAPCLLIHVRNPSFDHRKYCNPPLKASTLKENGTFKKDSLKKNIYIYKNRLNEVLTSFTYNILADFATPEASRNTNVADTICMTVVMAESITFLFMCSLIVARMATTC